MDVMEQKLEESQPTIDEVYGKGFDDGKVAAKEETGILQEALRLACKATSDSCNEYTTCKKGCYCDADHFIEQAKKTRQSKAANN